jgi:hypothetical protein
MNRAGNSRLPNSISCMWRRSSGAPGWESNRGTTWAGARLAGFDVGQPGGAAAETDSIAIDSIVTALMVTTLIGIVELKTAALARPRNGPA